jgi:hypothetical protein
MIDNNMSNYHVQYGNLRTQHWDPDSEVFAGGDHLVTAIYRGWSVEECHEETHWYEGMRSVRVYHFYLVKDDERLHMPVIANPYVERFVHQQGLTISEKRDINIA